MTHGLFVRLVHEVPNINDTVRTANDYHTSSEWRKTSASDHAVFIIVALENGVFNAFFVQIEAVIIQCENDIIEERRTVKTSATTIALRKIVIINHRIRTVDVLIGTDSPFDDEDFSFIGRSCKLRFFTVLLESEQMATHGTLTFRTIQLHAVIGFPGNRIIQVSFNVFFIKSRFPEQHLSGLTDRDELEGFSPLRIQRAVKKGAFVEFNSGWQPLNGSHWVLMGRNVAFDRVLRGRLRRRRVL